MIIDTITDLQNRGFTMDFNLLGNKLFCPQTKCFINSDEFDIVEVYSFEDDMVNLSETVLYAIECFAFAAKGILLETGHDNASILLSKIKKFWK